MKKIFLIAIFSFVFASHAQQNTFFINVPEAEFNNPDHPARDGVTLPFFYLAQAAKKLGYEVKNTKEFNLQECAGCFFVGAAQVSRLESAHLRPSNCLLSVWEPPMLAASSYQDFSPYKILHLATDYVDNKTRFKYFYPQPSLEIEQEIPSFKQKKLCVMINGYKLVHGPGELYSARRDVISFFEKKYKKNNKGRFEFYGEGGWPRSFKTYRGAVAHKRPILKQYRFCICYENCSNVPGYVTEKIFDCLVSGCVPVYWGAENITDYVDADCFIDRRKFANNKHLYKFMKKMSQDEYERYIENIKRYLKSEKAYLFSTDYFVDIVLSHLFPGYDKERVFNQAQITMLKRTHDYYESIAL